jgi:hypothetical protein
MVSSISCDCRRSLLILLYIGHICDDRLALRVPALEASKHENEMEEMMMGFSFSIGSEFCVTDCLTHCLQHIEQAHEPIEKQMKF